MKKIISLFKRDYEGTRLVYDEIVPGAEWVLAGEGKATRKWDGTPCLWKDGKLWKRFDRKQGRPAPDGWIPCEDAPDPNTGHWPGWVPVGDGSDDCWFNAALGRRRVLFGNDLGLEEGQSYELLGPKIQGNPEHTPEYILVPHGAFILDAVPRDFTGIKNYLSDGMIEGIVWHHPDGRMVKIKGKDFGFKRTTEAERLAKRSEGAEK